MHQILFYIGSFPVRSYGTIVALSILIAIGISTYFAKLERKYEEHITSLSIWAIIGALIGARFWQVFFFDWATYQHNLSEIFAVWHGGMSIQGGLVGGFVGGAIYTYRHKLLFWEIADIMAPGVIIGQAVGRIACLLNGDAFGSPTGSNFGLVYPPGTYAYDVYGSQPLWPAEVWEGQWDLIVFVLLIFFKMKKRPTGYIFLAYNILYSIGRVLLEILRGDSPRFAHLTAAQWTSLAVIVIGLGLMAYLRIKPAKTSEPRDAVQEEAEPTA